MKHIPLAAVTLALSAQACAYPLDAQLDCHVSASHFITTLDDKHLIEPRPSRVETNSVNVFDPVTGADLSAYGFHVFKVLGYQEGDSRFVKGSGKTVGDSAYGVVVFGGADAVKAAAEAAGSKALIHHVWWHVSAIFCNRGSD